MKGGVYWILSGTTFVRPFKTQCMYCKKIFLTDIYARNDEKFIDPKLAQDDFRLAFADNYILVECPHCDHHYAQTTDSFVRNIPITKFEKPTFKFRNIFVYFKKFLTKDL